MSDFNLKILGLIILIVIIGLFFWKLDNKFGREYREQKQLEIENCYSGWVKLSGRKDISFDEWKSLAIHELLPKIEIKEK